MQVLLSLPPFWRVFLVAILAFIFVSLIPVPFLSSLLAWGIVAAAGWQYPVQLGDKIQNMSSPTGYAIGMGALMGAAVNFVGVLVMVILSTIFAGIAFSAASHAAHGVSDAAALGGIGAGLGMMAWLISAVFAPFWGAALGALGGLIGGSQVPKREPSA